MPSDPAAAVRLRHAVSQHNGFFGSSSLSVQWRIVMRLQARLKAYSLALRRIPRRKMFSQCVQLFALWFASPAICCCKQSK